jgi:MYXO-CTERM domain-containing protein
MNKTCTMIAALGTAAGAGTAHAELAYAVTSNQTLVSFDTGASNALLSGVAISGLMSNEQIRGIDFRPANGALYALGSFSNLYRVDTATGAATRVGTGVGLQISGSSFGFDFNPVIDRIRVVSDTGVNYVFNPDTGSATQVTSLFYDGGDSNNGMTPNVTSSAYTNSFAGTTSTQLYGIDTGLDLLVRQANSAGTLETVGSLGADISDSVGFDISGATGAAFAVTSGDGTRSVLWSIDLNTGAASMIGEIGGGATLTSFAVVPAPGAFGLLAVGTLAAARRRR